MIGRPTGGRREKSCTCGANLSNDVIVQTGSNSDNYAITVNVTDTTSTSNPGYYPGVLPTTGFQFDASSTAGAGTGSPAANYGTIYSYLIPQGGYALNGNILAHSDFIMGDWAFQYDSLNRLTMTAPADNAPSTFVHSIGCWNYDEFGNRTVADFVTGTDCSQAVNTSTYNTSNQATYVSQGTPISYLAPNGFTYDSAGNVVNDGNNNYAYDAEGRLCAVQTIVNNAVTAQNQYLYNAGGLRVGKATFTGTFPAKNTTCVAPGAAPNFTLSNQYLLDQSGNQVTELNTSSGTMAWAHSNVFAGSHLDATYDLVKINGVLTPALHFHIADPLGTRRVQTNSIGRVEENCQSLPFGDGLNCIKTALSTADDATEHHFTGKERDTESGNDYFGARYYASSMGRWLSPDWSAKQEPVPYAKLDNPQSLNLYAYLENNPLRTTDPDGHGDKEDYAAKIAAQAASENGRDNWDISKIDISNGQVFWSGSNKCNEFVSDQVVYAGGPAATVVGTDKIATAAQMADPNVKIAGFSEPRPLSEAKPGDMIAQDHGPSADGKSEDAHAGIVVAPGKTASSNAEQGGRVTVNDWGFRDPNSTHNNGERHGAASPPPVVRHPLPPPTKPDGPPRP